MTFYVILCLFFALVVLINDNEFSKFEQYFWTQEKPRIVKTKRLISTKDDHCQKPAHWIASSGAEGNATSPSQSQEKISNGREKDKRQIE